MDKSVFLEFCRIVYDTSGIRLNDSKEALVSSRIGKRMRKLGLSTHREYLDLVKADNTGEEIVHMIDVISTNVTSFYRESDHFIRLTEVLTRMREAGQTRFRLWCAAASTGEEPYTLAITMNEVFQNQNIDWKILATDISISVLERCQRAVYDAAKLKPISPQLKARYFNRVGDRDDETYEVKEFLRQRIAFRRLNLATPPFPIKGPLDIVFVRNVMIYFDNEVRNRLIQEVVRLLRPQGYLFVGHAESLNGILNGLRPVCPSVYQAP